MFTRSLSLKKRHQVLGAPSTQIGLALVFLAGLVASATELRPPSFPLSATVTNAPLLREPFLGLPAGVAQRVVFAPIDHGLLVTRRCFLTGLRQTDPCHQERSSVGHSSWNNARG